MNTSHIVDFLRVNGLLEGCRNYLDVMGRGRNGDGSGGLTELQVFFRVLDKNMKVGFGTRLMKGVEKVPTEAEGSTIKPEGDETSGGPTTTSIRKDLESDPLPATMHLSPSLGKTILLPDLPKLFQSQSHPTWYASRKLDGVRCLVVVDVVIETTPNVSRESDSNVKVKFLRGQAYSRTGKAFATLGEVTQDIESVCDGWSGLATLLKDEPYLTYSDSEIDGRTASRGIKRFVLDGETCILRPSVEEGGALVEDFKEIVSLVRRKQGTIPNVSMFLLDLLPWGSFHPGDLRQDFPMRAKTFGDRLKDCAAFLTRMKEVKKGEEGTIRALGQNVVRCVEDVESLIGTAAEEGWEGLILRKDVAYEGKRT
jgi:DNA ligase-1